ncbi:hypothetical protein [Aeromonas caviae]|uniref:Uncharacterized protein n=1 Tax=Aeromonas caviae TaxID=648 RepID=A0AAJ5ZAP2_AERCA|nr:hypothetical protein [Aeromonas caviae]RWT81234.1 hypothetical protein DN604_00245 [Aeromonas caviae]WFG00183.1 hypothetical protein P5S46_22060 [Aeromonas caviae]
MNAKANSSEADSVTFLRPEDAVKAASAWAADFEKLGNYALQVNELYKRTAPYFKSNVSRYHDNVAFDAHLVKTGVASGAFLNERIGKVVQAELDRVNGRFGHIYDLNMAEFLTCAALEERISIEICVLDTVSMVPYIMGIASPEQIAHLSQLAEDRDLASFESYLLNNDLDSSRGRASRHFPALMRAWTRYLNLDPQTKAECTQRISEQDPAACLKWMVFLIEHFFYPEEIKAILADASANVPACITDKMRVGLKNHFKANLVNAVPCAGKPVTLSINYRNDNADLKIKELSRFINCAYQIMGEYNPERHLTEYAMARSNGNFRGTNGQSIRIFKETAKTTVSGETYEKMIAILDTPATVLVDMAVSQQRNGGAR